MADMRANPYYVPLEGQPPNLLASWVDAYLARKTPWTQTILLEQLRQLRPGQGNDAMAKIREQRVKTLEALAKLERENIVADREAKISGDTVVREVIGYEKAVLQEQGASSRTNAEIGGDMATARKLSPRGQELYAKIQGDANAAAFDLEQAGDDEAAQDAVLALHEKALTNRKAEMLSLPQQEQEALRENVARMSVNANSAAAAAIIGNVTPFFPPVSAVELPKAGVRGKSMEDIGAEVNALRGGTAPSAPASSSSSSTRSSATPPAAASGGSSSPDPADPAARVQDLVPSGPRSSVQQLLEDEVRRSYDAEAAAGVERGNPLAGVGGFYVTRKDAGASRERAARPVAGDRPAKGSRTSPSQSTSTRKIDDPKGSATPGFGGPKIGKGGETEYVDELDMPVPKAKKSSSQSSSKVDDLVPPPPTKAEEETAGVMAGLEKAPRTAPSQSTTPNPNLRLPEPTKAPAAEERGNLFPARTPIGEVSPAEAERIAQALRTGLANASSNSGANYAAATAQSLGEVYRDDAVRVGERVLDQVDELPGTVAKNVREGARDAAGVVGVVDDLLGVTDKAAKVGEGVKAAGANLTKPPGEEPVEERDADGKPRRAPKRKARGRDGADRAPRPPSLADVGEGNPWPLQPTDTNSDLIAPGTGVRKATTPNPDLKLPEPTVEVDRTAAGQAYGDALMARKKLEESIVSSPTEKPDRIAEARERLEWLDSEIEENNRKLRERASGI